MESEVRIEKSPNARVKSGICRVKSGDMESEVRGYGE